MTNFNQPVRFLSILLITLIASLNGLLAQENEYSVSGTILESGSGIPITRAVLSVASNGEFTNSDIEGKFIIELPSKAEVLTFSYPGYHTTEYYTSGEKEIIVYLTELKYNSDDEVYTTPFGTEKLKNATNAVTLLSNSVFENSASSSFDQTMVGKAAGMHMIEHSGMAGHKSWINLRGISSIYARNEPLVFIDGMIHEINYPNNQIIEGHSLNPMDLIDVDDIINISVIKAGEGYLGSAGSNGVININTAESDNTSAAILVKMYGGISFPFAKQDVMDAGQFKNYYTDLLASEGKSSSAPSWLNGGSSDLEYYRYNNNTDWQSELSRPSALQKYYIYLTGGDDIATYNISSGYTRHGAAYDEWNSSRYNLRLNGKVNISKNLYIVPNTKLSLSDTYLSNMGPTSERNPIVASLQKSPMMFPNERSPIDGSTLYPIDDVGDFNISNPAAIIQNSLGSARSFQLLSSVKAGYVINSNFTVSHLIGISVNNDRQNIFVPNVGLVQLDSAKNNPMDMVTEFRSTQNHTTLTYKNTFNKNHHIVAYGGLRTMNNLYKNNYAVDLNTASDDFRSLGAGSQYSYLRSNDGEISSLNWMSVFADVNYQFDEKYYLRASLSFDGSSAFNKKNRYNFYPSIFGAWRVSSSESINLPAWINDLKLRASISQTGNMFSSAYLRSKTTYTGRNYTGLGVPVRDYITNEDLSAEKKFSVNTGFDLSFNKKAYNIHLDYHMSRVNNLIINQDLPYNYGFTDYYDNGGSLAINGVELATDGRWILGESVLVVDASVTYQASKVKKLDFINPETESIITEVPGAEYIASIDNPLNAFYGFKTNGIYSTDAAAGGMIGPAGKPMGGGDVSFVDVDGNGTINENDKQIIGNPNPDLFGSLSGALTYKRFTFSTIFTYSVGNDVFNYVKYKNSSMDSYANQSIDVLDRWQSGSTNTTLPKAAIGDPNGNNVFSDRWIEDGSYLRVKQFMVSYKTPRVFMLEKEATFYVTGTNLLTLTKYTGYDPESMYQSDPYYMGIDYGKLPLARSIIFGIQLSL
ncbi:MAG: SusC/RagA family TonB-linked outer membrane protein [Salinivirgaceae bacterium]|jgi:TonB-linked SusC/RagA family outer membrane protein|nr:SusC/RagA family TonB-linked outer membrane protein [Salinivirgaceae bacterium]